MELSEEKIRQLTKKLMMIRLKVLSQNGFYGLLLMHVKMTLSNQHETAWVSDDECFAFNPEFLDKISDMELCYVLHHMIMHVVLKHVARRNDRKKEVYDMASDIVVNSNILKSYNGETEYIRLDGYGGIQPHLLPDGTEGADYTVEKVYEILLHNMDEKEAEKAGWDYHEENENISNIDAAKWERRIESAVEAVKNDNTWGKGIGSVPVLADRLIKKLRKPSVDWRTILDEFVQEEITDYSFFPPDRRMQDSPFFLPDYNDKEFIVRKVLFMIDTSGSMSDKEICQAYSEIKGAIDQFNGILSGWLGFFDAEIVEPKPFVDENEFRKITPQGGGGTSFDIIFDYVHDQMMDDPPVSIVILTDGYAFYPNEEVAVGIPVLWIINNNEVTPPWGKIARMNLHD